MRVNFIIGIITALTTGILCGSLQWVPLWSALVPVGIAIGLYLFSMWIKKRNPFRQTFLINNLITWMIFLGIGDFSSFVGRPSQIHFEKKKYKFTGEVKDYTVTNSGDRVLVNLTSLSPVEGSELKIRNVNALLTLLEATNVNYGDFISGEATLLPYDTPGNYLKEDYEKYLATKHIFLTGHLTSSQFAISKEKLSFPHNFKTFRDRLEEEIEKSDLSVETKEFLISILLGDKNYIRKSDRITFTDAGIAHIFAVSGFHVSMIAGFILGLLSLFFTGRWRGLKFLFVIPLVWLYIFLVGMSPATCRAGIMLTIGMFALFCQRKNSPLKALAWAIIIILCFDATALFDIGFQLSVICVASILLIAQPLNFINHRNNPRLHKVVSLLLVTLVASFSTWLICAFYFHRFSLMFLPLNLLAVPFLPGFVICAIVYLILFHFGISLSFMATFLNGCYSFFQDSALKLNSVNSPFTDLFPSSLSVILWVFGLAVLGYSMYKLDFNKRPKVKVKSFFTSCGVFGLSILTLFVLPTDRKTGLIIQRNSHAATIACYKDGIETLVTLPENKTSMATLNGKKIVALDSDDLDLKKLENVLESDLILICKGCKSLPEELLQLRGRKARLIIHPGIHWQYERRMLSECEEKGLDVHSLRYDGPLHLFE